MADEEQDGNENTTENQNNDDKPAGSGKLKRIVLFAILGLILIGISVGGTLTALRYLNPPPALEIVEGEDGQAPQEEVKKKAIYYPIKPEIIVTYSARGRQRYMRADITLLIRDTDVIAAIETHMPMIRNTLNMVMAGQVYQEVQTAEGKEYMRQECLLQLRKNIEAEIGKPGIEEVLFTNIVMQ